MKLLTKRKLHLNDNHIFFMVYIIYTFGIKKSVSKYIFNMETVRDLFSWTSKSLQMMAAAMKLKDTCSLEEKL